MKTNKTKTKKDDPFSELPFRQFNELTTQKAQHTAGEWVVKEARQNPHDPIFYTSKIICGGIQLAQVVGVGKETAEANAHLIASAPELLFCLQLAIAKHDGKPCFENKDIQFMRETLAKATGKDL